MPPCGRKRFGRAMVAQIPAAIAALDAAVAEAVHEAARQHHAAGGEDEADGGSVIAAPARRGVHRAAACQRHGRQGRVLAEVGQILKLADGTLCSEAAEFAAQRLTDVRARLADLKRMEAALSKLVSECDAHHGNVSCRVDLGIALPPKSGALRARRIHPFRDLGPTCTK